MPGGSRNGVVGLVTPSHNGISFDGSWVGCEADLLKYVWGVLKANERIVKWALCRAGASDNLTECVLEHLHGERSDIDLRLTSDCEAEHKGLWESIFGNNPDDDTYFKVRTHVFPEKYMEFCKVDLERFHDLFCRDFGGQHCGDCAILALASIFLHEMTHLCAGGTHPSKDDPDTWWDDRYCSVPYLTGSFFAQAIFQRYWKAATCSCCAPLLAHRPGTSHLPLPSDDCYTRTPDVSGPTAPVGPGGYPPGDGEGGPFVEFLPPPGPAVSAPFEVYYLLDGAQIYI